MDDNYLARLKQTHPTLRLLNAHNAPLIISFLFRVLIESTWAVPAPFGAGRAIG